MATSKIPDIISYLVTLFQGAATLGQANPPVKIWDGPVVSGEPPPLMLYVGIDDPDSDDVPTSATSEQTWAGLGKQAKNEQFTIFCTAEAWSGDTDMATLRIQAFQIFAAVEDLARGDVMLGGNVQFQGVSGATLRQSQRQTGAVAQVSFQIEGQARI